MNKRELESLNAELIDFLVGLREQIGDKLDELGATEAEDDEPDADDEIPDDED